MNCTKTGAYILVRPHNFHLVGDVYGVGNCNVFRVNHESMSYTPVKHITHIVNLEHESWDRLTDLGVLVVPVSQVLEVIHVS